LKLLHPVTEWHAFCSSNTQFDVYHTWQFKSNTQFDVHHTWQFKSNTQFDVHHTWQFQSNGNCDMSLFTNSKKNVISEFIIFLLVTVGQFLKLWNSQGLLLYIVLLIQSLTTCYNLGYWCRNCHFNIIISISSWFPFTWWYNLLNTD
jgi:hypothetical protein